MKKNKKIIILVLVIVIMLNTEKKTGISDIICIGDSNTGVTANLSQSYCQQLHLKYGYTTYKHGYSGYTSYDMAISCSGGLGDGSGRDGCVNEVLALNEDAGTVIFMIGTNDLYRGTNPTDVTSIEEYYTYVTKSVVDMKSAGKTVLLSTIPPCNAALNQCENNDQTNVTERNDVIRRISDEQNVYYVDIFNSVFSGTWTPELMKWDGVHIRYETDSGQAFPCNYVHGDGVQDCGQLLVADAYQAALQNPQVYDCDLNPGTCYSTTSTHVQFSGYSFDYISGSTSFSTFITQANQWVTS